MKTAFSKLDNRGRTTLPKSVRHALKLEAGDTLAYRRSKHGVSLTRAQVVDRAFLKAIESTLSEWDSPEDAEAYDNL